MLPLVVTSHTGGVYVFIALSLVPTFSALFATVGSVVQARCVRCAARESYLDRAYVGARWHITGMCRVEAAVHLWDAHVSLPSGRGKGTAGPGSRAHSDV